MRTVELPAGTSRIVIADLLTWVSETGRYGFLDVYVADDGRMEFRARNCGPLANDVKAQFHAFCRRERIEPTSPFDRWERNYTGEGLQDGVYEVTVGEAKKFAEAFDLELKVATPTHQPEPVPAPAIAAQVERVQPAPASADKARRDLMTPVIEAAQSECKDPFDASQVWPVMVRMCKENRAPMRGQTEDGIQWIDGEDEAQFFSVKNLRDRLRRGRERLARAR